MNQQEIGTLFTYVALIICGIGNQHAKDGHWLSASVLFGNALICMAIGIRHYLFT